MGFVQNDAAVFPEQGVQNGLTQEHAIGQELDFGVVRGDIVEAHRVANLCRGTTHSFNKWVLHPVYPGGRQALVLVQCNPTLLPGKWTRTLSCNDEKLCEECNTSPLPSATSSEATYTSEKMPKMF